MVSAEQQKLVKRYIKHALDNEHRIVTYREIAREIQCHVNGAKNILLEYLPQSSATPTYLLTGPLKTTSTLTQLPSFPSRTPKSGPTATQSLRDLAGNGMVRIVDMDEISEGERNSDDGEDVEPDGMGNDEGAEDGLGGVVDVKEEKLEGEKVKRWGVVLVQQDELDDKVELFEHGQITISVYSLAPKPVVDPAQYLIPNLALRERKDYHNPGVYGSVTGESLKASGSGSGGMKDGGMTFGKGKVEIGSKGKGKAVEEERTTEKQAVQQEQGETKGEKRSGKQDSVKADTKKAEVKKNKDPTPPPPVTASKKEPPKPRASQKARKRVMESEDEDEGEATSSAPPPVEPTSSARRADDAAAMEAMMGMDVDDELEETQESVKEEEPVKVKREPGARKKRKVKVTVQEMNAKGYMVSKDVEREESYSGDSETEIPVKAKTTAKKPIPPAPARKPSLDSNKGSSASIGSNAGAKPPAKKPEAKKGGQSTLAGFFKKK